MARTSLEYHPPARTWSVSESPMTKPSSSMKVLAAKAMSSGPKRQKPSALLSACIPHRAGPGACGSKKTVWPEVGSPGANTCTLGDGSGWDDLEDASCCPDVRVNKIGGVAKRS